jgi:hypothetical protein
MPNMKTMDQRILKLMGGQAFWSQDPCDLDLWLVDLKINMGHLIIMTYLHAKYKDWVIGFFSYWTDKLYKVKGPVTLTFDLVTLNHQVSSTYHHKPPCKLWRMWVQEFLGYIGRQAFWRKCPCDLLPSDLKIHRGHFIIMANLHAKYEDCGSKDFKVIGWTSFLRLRPLRSSPCFNRGHLLIMPNLHARYEDCESKDSKVISRTSFLSQGSCDLDLWHGDLKINHGHLLIIINLHAEYKDSGSKDI